jgi:hypothetical protein
MGIPGPVINNIDVADNDSLYVFVSVHINQSNANLPFIVRDSIEVWSNGNKRVVQLEAYGRNAHFIRSKVIESSEVWNNDLPYVIVGGVEVDENVKLTINEGCKVYMHADAPFIISGTLEVRGWYLQVIDWMNPIVIIPHPGLESILIPPVRIM